MKTRDITSSGFWLSFSIIVCVDSIRMGAGTFSNPGMGFIGFWSAALLGLLSLVLLVQTLFKKGEIEVTPLFKGLLWGRVVAIFVALLLYSKLMPILGYLVSTFILMSFLFWVMGEGQKWWWSPIYASAITLAAFLIFSVWLNGQYPQGLFSF